MAKRSKTQEERNRQFRNNFFPKNPSMALLREREREAVRQENYEDAARIRDWMQDIRDLFGENAETYHM